MKQHNIFDYMPTVNLDEPARWKLFIDGASRNNPGPAGAGFYLLKNQEFFLKKGFFLGNKTNNQAEYFALLIGLFYLKKYVHEGDSVHIISDSQLLVKQLHGIYKIRSPELQPLYVLAVTMLKSVHGTISHVLRTDNQEADAMANYGINERVALPSEFLSLLISHDITYL